MTISQYSDRTLNRKIRGLRRIFDECDRERRPGKRRFAHYYYLQSVYELFREMGGASTTGKEVAKRIIEIYGIKPRDKSGLMRVIISATSSDVDPKMASRWTQALRFIWRQRFEWSSWQKFVEENGGVAGCARSLATFKKEMRALTAEAANNDLIAAQQRAGMRKRLLTAARRSSADAKFPLLFRGGIVAPTTRL